MQTTKDPVALQRLYTQQVQGLIQSGAITPEQAKAIPQKFDPNFVHTMSLQNKDHADLVNQELTRRQDQQRIGIEAENAATNRARAGAEIAHFGAETAKVKEETANLKAGNADISKPLPNPGDENIAKAIAAGRQPVPSSSRQNPRMAAIADRANVLNPKLDAGTYKARAKTEADYTPGGAVGKQLAAGTTVYGHLDTAQKAADALGNRDIQTFNKWSNKLATETGSAKPTNMREAGKIVGDEMVKSLIPVGGTGTSEDRKTVEGFFSDVSSPEQFKGAVQQAKDFIQQKRETAAQEYYQYTGEPLSDRYPNPDKNAPMDPGYTHQFNGDAKHPAGTYQFQGGDVNDFNNWKLQ